MFPYPLPPVTPAYKFLAYKPGKWEYSCARVTQYMPHVRSNCCRLPEKNFVLFFVAKNTEGYTDSADSMQLGVSQTKCSGNTLSSATTLARGRTSPAENGARHRPDRRAPGKSVRWDTVGQPSDSSSRAV